MLDKSVRCDGCGAEAWVSVKKKYEYRDPDAWQVDSGSGELVPVPATAQLDFCAHHYNANSIILHAEGWAISADERELINTKPSVSANAD